MFFHADSAGFLTGREFLKFFMEINRDKIRSDQTIDDYFDLVKSTERTVIGSSKAIPTA